MTSAQANSIINEINDKINQNALQGDWINQVSWTNHFCELMQWEHLGGRKNLCNTSNGLQICLRKTTDSLDIDRFDYLDSNDNEYTLVVYYERDTMTGSYLVQNQRLLAESLEIEYVGHLAVADALSKEDLEGLTEEEIEEEREDLEDQLNKDAIEGTIREMKTMKASNPSLRWTCTLERDDVAITAGDEYVYKFMY